MQAWFADIYKHTRRFKATRLIAEKALKRPVAGLSIGVMKDNRIVLARGYGFADLGKKQPATIATRYQIGSIYCSLKLVLPIHFAKPQRSAQGESAPSTCWAHVCLILFHRIVTVVRYPNVCTIKRHSSADA